MASNEVTKPGGGPLQRPTDVFGAMRNEMDRLFERFESGWPTFPSLLGRYADRDMMVPELDVRDNGKQVTIEVDLPGVEEKDVAVMLTNGRLTIKGEKKSAREDTKDNYYLSERSYGAFERAIQLPDTIEEAKLEAKFDKGVLRITAPKKPEAVKAERKIEIKKS